MAERQAGSVLETRPRPEETAGLMRISDIRDVKVRNPEGEELGDLTDLAIDRESGCIAYAVLSYGGILGFGEKHFAVPWEAVRSHPGERVFVVDADKRTLDSAPGFARDAMPREGDWSLIRTLPPPSGERGPPPSREEKPAETKLPGAERNLPPQPAVQTVAGGWGGQPTRRRTEERPVEAEARPRETVVEEVHEEPARARAVPPSARLSAADLQVYLKGMDYPAEKQDLISHARGQNAPEDVIATLEQFGERTYRSAADVSVEFGRVK
ncbi:DUF2795 domain-containing protein [Methanoculleus sp. 7T]|uniref:DUF2795 domain-containing protein n=1 Tax=Methanoculleus sp. 7T TaxID=2937282 RepID=UPI0020BF31B9|nr:DUF2795 domain-containing protein [Methanoculleus sp. 7T]MCK8518201.1 DUF2795 domain-containing protein [Methanoculleus sp. 7T]